MIDCMKEKKKEVFGVVKTNTIFVCLFDLGCQEAKLETSKLDKNFQISRNNNLEKVLTSAIMTLEVWGETYQPQDTPPLSTERICER